MARRLSFKTLGNLAAMLALFLVLIASLYVLATTAERLDQFGRYYHVLLLINGLALTALTVLIGINGWRLIDEFRRRVAGSRLTLRLVIMSVFLALVPVTLVYGFSVKFLRSNIDSWYDLEIEQALDDALELSRDSLGLQMRTLQRVTVDVAEQLTGVTDTDAIVTLNSLNINVDASEMTLIGPDNRIIASTGLPDNLSVQPNRPDDDLAARARAGLSYVGVDPIGNGDLYIRVVTPVFADSTSEPNNVLQALYPIATRSSDLAESVQSSYQKYRQLVFLRRPLKISSIVTLSLALLLSVLMAVWFALYSARRMMVPVHDLVEGTRAVAQGDYSARIYKRGQDELGFLVQSFNYMTLQLEHTRNAAALSQAEVEQQRSYLETVLGRISSGVLTLDTDNCVRTANQAAANIIGCDADELEGQSLSQQLSMDLGVLQQFCDQVMPQLKRAAGQDWSCELEVYDHGGRRFLFCRGATLYDGTEQPVGTVVVVDDMTTIIGAQREAAWGEVARRLAHEIKNPLTPIQLSAERLRHKYLDKLEGKDADALKRLTSTIENQVDSMKEMVNAFADYASTPSLSLARTDINDLVSDVVELYQTTESRVTIKLELTDRLDPVMVDAPRMRQLIHNLIKNSIEAQVAGEDRVITLSTREVMHQRRRMLELVTEDNGPGFPVELLGRLFEPYVTSKPKGTGLGLAIVKKIVEEHNGSVVAENAPDCGARISVRLPMSATVVHFKGDAA
ncbi:MAG: HAMP domain-containing protein [Gammaproteobacteria bacterium]|nr:HAMP domain-containing protein [Gammaproteobacteria bacterium]